MKKAFKFGSPFMTIAMFALAGILLFGSSIGGARAALTYFSETYTSHIEMYDIGVTLNENGKGVSWRNYIPNSDGKWKEETGKLLVGMCSDEEPLQIGRAYDEVITAKNTGTIDEYVRVTLYTYWVNNDNNSSKVRHLSPDLIKLNLVNQGKDWLLDKEASTAERKVFYYNRILKSGEETPALTDTLTIDDSVADMVTITEEVVEYQDESGKVKGKRITTSYDYDGLEFQIEATVDAVQTHNAEDAIWSAWGRRVNINNGKLSLR